MDNSLLGKEDDKLEHFCLQQDCCANISSSFSDLMEIPRVLHDLQFMDMVFLARNDNPVLRYYDDYHISMTVAERYFNGDNNLIQSPLLDKITKYDKEHGTDYYGTLETFFECHADNKKIAQKLYIHSNTAMYRIRRLSELFGIDFGDYRIMSDLYYSLMLRTLAERLNRTEPEQRSRK